MQHNLLASQTFPSFPLHFPMQCCNSLFLSVCCCSLLLPLVLPAFFCLSHTHTWEQRRPQHRTRSQSSYAAQHVRGEIVRHVRAATKVNLLQYHALSLALTHTLLLWLLRLPRLLLRLCCCFSFPWHSAAPPNQPQGCSCCHPTLSMCSAHCF